MGVMPPGAMSGRALVYVRRHAVLHDPFELLQIHCTHGGACIGVQHWPQHPAAHLRDRGSECGIIDLIGECGDGRLQQVTELRFGGEPVVDLVGLELVDGGLGRGRTERGLDALPEAGVVARCRVADAVHQQYAAVGRPRL